LKPQIVGRKLGFAYRNVAVPVNDTRDQYSAVRGVVRRLLIETPKPDPREIREFRSFVRIYLRRAMHRYGLRPLSRVKTFDEWVANINHPDWRKTELREAEELLHLGLSNRQKFKSEYHGKIEFYEGFKENRGICARVDPAKVMFGPAISSIEDAVYSKIPEFVKHIPIVKLAKRISERCRRFGPEHIIATDYTSFEGHFNPDLMKACECQLYRFMLKHADPSLAETICAVISGKNVVESKTLNFSVQGCRMSGDMMTSLGNGFTNLMIIKYLSKKLKFDMEGFVEGDDGLFLIKGQVPNAGHYEKLGFTVKMDVFLDAHVASFCGQVFDPESGDLIIDPVYVSATLGWTLSEQKHGGPKVMAGLLRSKAISLAYSAPSCPVVQSLARKLLSLTTGVVARRETFHGHQDWWQHRLLGDSVVLSDDIFDRLSSPPTPSARQVMADVFHISVDDQILLEKHIDSLVDLSDWSHPVLDRLMNSSYFRFYEENVRSFAVGSSMSDPFSPDEDWLTVVDVRGLSWSPQDGPDAAKNKLQHLASGGRYPSYVPVVRDV